MSDATPKVEPQGPTDLKAYWGIWDHQWQRWVEQGGESYCRKQASDEPFAKFKGTRYEAMPLYTPYDRDMQVCERDALRAENAAKDAEIERLERHLAESDSKRGAALAEIGRLQSVEIGLRSRIESSVAALHELEAGNARLRGEGPIRVGDVVQDIDPRGIGEFFIVEGFDEGWIKGAAGRVTEWLKPSTVRRIGRAVRMPDGSPVAEPVEDKP